MNTVFPVTASVAQEQSQSVALAANHTAKLFRRNAIDRGRIMPEAYEKKIDQSSVSYKIAQGCSLRSQTTSFPLTPIRSPSTVLNEPHLAPNATNNLLWPYIQNFQHLRMSRFFRNSDGSPLTKSFALRHTINSSHPLSQRSGKKFMNGGMAVIPVYQQRPPPCCIGGLKPNT